MGARRFFPPERTAMLGAAAWGAGGHDRTVRRLIGPGMLVCRLADDRAQSDCPRWLAEILESVAAIRKGLEDSASSSLVSESRRRGFFTKRESHEPTKPDGHRAGLFVDGQARGRSCKVTGAKQCPVGRRAGYIFAQPVAAVARLRSSSGKHAPPRIGKRGDHR